MSDILMIEQGDGGEFCFSGGDIESDNTFYTAGYLSLFNGDCFYNVFSKYPRNKEFEDSLNCIITANNLKNIETKANATLDWMVSERLASEISTSAYNNDGKQINVEISITKPDGTIQKFKIIWDNEQKTLKEFGRIG